ncbi:leucine-rich repeat, cysteine-containing subtype protein [Tanacetum coccineum]
MSASVSCLRGVRIWKFYPLRINAETGLQVIGKVCKKLRKLTHHGVGVVTHLGSIVVAKGCTNLESLKVSLTDISNEALECVGTHLKNLCTFHMDSVKKVRTKELLLDNGVRAMLMGCSKLERLDIRKSNAGLVKLSEGRPRLRKLSLKWFSLKQTSRCQLCV